MGRELGRISGPLLSENLRRNGVDLAVDTDLLYLNVSGKQVGFHTNIPVRDLTIPTTADTTNLIVDTLSEIANFSISGNQIQNPLTTITISPNQTANPTIVAPGTLSGNVKISSNIIANNLGNNLEFTPAAGGITEINGNATVNGDLHATGNITWDGNITLGNAPTDTVTFDAEITSDLLPSTSYTDNLGSLSKTWKTLESYNFKTTNLNTTLTNSGILNVGNFSFTGTTITDTSATSNVSIQPSGTGNVVVNGTVLNIPTGNSITNMSNSAFTLDSTAQGHWKFAGTNGVVLPTGSTAQEPSAPEIGTTRFNTDTGSIELWNGTSWGNPIGPQTTITTDQVTDISTVWTLILGL